MFSPCFIEKYFWWDVIDGFEQFIILVWIICSKKNNVMSKIVVYIHEMKNTLMLL